MGEATNFKFGRYIQRVHTKKSRLKIWENLERGHIQGLPKFFEYPLLSQERIKLRTSNFVCTFLAPIGTKPFTNFEKSSRGRLRGLSKLFRAFIYWAHRTVVFAIARLSCSSTCCYTAFIALPGLARICCLRSTSWIVNRFLLIDFTPAVVFDSKCFDIVFVMARDRADGRTIIIVHVGVTDSTCIINSSAVATSWHSITSRHWAAELGLSSQLLGDSPTNSFNDSIVERDARSDLVESLLCSALSPPRWDGLKECGRFRSADGTESSTHWSMLDELLKFWDLLSKRGVLPIFCELLHKPDCIVQAGQSLAPPSHFGLLSALSD